MVLAGRFGTMAPAVIRISCDSNEVDLSVQKKTSKANATVYLAIALPTLD